MAGLKDVRSFALALPEASEEPHFERASYRVRSKIFATLEPTGESVNIFVDEDHARAAVADHPEAFAILTWGKQARGVTVRLPEAPLERVEELLTEAWRRRAPARLVQELDSRDHS